MRDQLMLLLLKLKWATAHRSDRRETWPGFWTFNSRTQISEEPKK
jgi:hypothetical protein